MPQRKPKFRLYAITWVLLATIGGLILVFSIPLLMAADEWFLQFFKSLLLVIALVLGLSEIRRLNLRLANLSRVANELGRGKYKTRAEVRGEDSVSLVAQALNTMAERIEATVTELETSHNELDRSREKLANQNLELSRAYERQSRFGEFLAKLNTIDLEALAGNSFPDLMAAARAQIGAIFLFDEKRQELRRLTEHGVDRAAMRRLVPEKGFDGLPGEAFARREWVTIDEIDQEILPELDLGIGSARIQSVYAIPLLFNTKALGVVVLGSLHKPSEGTVEILRNYIGALAQAFNNALTHQAVQQQTVQFETANTKLLSLDRHRRDFVANMSHELRTPLNSIIGFSSILLKNRGNAISPDNLDRVEKINRNGKNLLQLINDILDLSKIEAGRMETDFSAVEIPALMREVADMLQPQATAKSIDLNLELPEDPVVIETDPQKLRQVLINLANNAVKFTDKGAVTLRLLAPDPTKGPTIEVQDSGIGIGGDKLESIFEAFRQAESTTARRYGGTGLGLTISRTLTTLIGGKIRVASKVGQGSTFTIELPLNPLASQDGPPTNTDDLLFDEPIPAEA